jgi:hypothetical protein
MVVVVVVDGATALVVVVVVVVDAGGRGTGIPPAEPGAALPPPGAAFPPEAVSLFGVSIGWAHTSPCGHGIDPGGLITGTHGADSGQLPVTPSLVR